MFGAKILLASQDSSLRRKLKNIFTKTGYSVVGEAEDGTTTLRMVRTMTPDLIILDYELQGLNAIELAKIIEEDRLAPVVIVSSSWDRDLAEKARQSWILAFLVRPINEGNLLAAAEGAMINYERMLKLEQEVFELKDTIETRKIIEKAKGLLMDNFGLSEAEAFRKIQHQSMDKCMPMKQVAEAIILTYDIAVGKKKLKSKI